ncbi:MAG TPA: hypothetical protein VNC50_16040, partial [Planctomycetia bacterium]|nr:hypothetical protein [Planctomycetia bacterium]
MTSENPDIPELEPLGVVVDLCALEAEIEKTRAELVGAPGARAETMLPRVQILDEGSRQLLVSIARLVALAQGRARPDRDLDAFERWLRHDVFTPANSASLAARLIAAKAAKTDPDLERLGRLLQERVDKAVEQMKAVVPFIRQRFQVTPIKSAAEIILAARMEQYGVPNRITLSEAASRQIADWAEFSDPTRIEDIH